MKVLILGGEGMLGHKMVQRLTRNHPDTWWTVRSPASELPLPFLRSSRCLEGVDARDWPALQRMLEDMQPDVVVNCVGVIKQRAEAHGPIPSIAINALLPHLLADATARWGGRLIHFSTDCVFNGAKGRYTEADQSDADDLYGRSKFLGETTEANALTLRTSMVGRELDHHKSLLDWFLLGGHRRVGGFTRVWWSGVTTNHLADVVGEIIDRHPCLSGLYQVSSGRISKYELLCRIRDAYHLNVEIEPNGSSVNDRSLDGSRFEAATGYHCPSWDRLIEQLVDDPTPYALTPQSVPR